MPVYAYLEYQDIPCPHCGSPLRCGFEPKPCYITFGWGYCPSRLPSEVIYKVGDAIYWRQGRDGVVRPWTSFDGGSRFNFGDPALSSVIVTDVGTDVAHFPRMCQQCKGHIGGAALHIKDNVIASAWPFLPGELRPGLPAVYYTVSQNGDLVQLPTSEAGPWQIVECYVEQEDGAWLPKPEWEYRGCDYFDS